MELIICYILWNNNVLLVIYLDNVISGVFSHLEYVT